MKQLQADSALWDGQCQADKIQEFLLRVKMGNLIQYGISEIS
jgi:hypothetical protein